MVLRWTDIMQTGTFDGIIFPIRRIASRGGRTLAMHTYPDVPGQEVEDQGRIAETFTVDAVWGPDLENIYGVNIYPEGWRIFKRRMDEGGSGIFVHPNWGEVNVAVLDYNYDEDASRPDTLRATMVFVEDSLAPFSLKDSTALSKQGDAQKRAEQIDIVLSEKFGFSFTLFVDLLVDFRFVLFAWNATIYAIQSKYLNVQAQIRALMDANRDIFDDASNWEILLEPIIQYQADLVELVNGIEKDFPLFATFTTTGVTDLITLSVKLYGSRDRWEELQSLNAAVVPNPLRVPAGVELVYQTS
jgi:prophage DNA circulation protein